ncbi:MAG: DUF1573 domain-containing protein [Flavobacteriales bacterium]|nr:DUF1573 domain-containing protein [Flavobacteriales bacterium]
MKRIYLISCLFFFSFNSIAQHNKTTLTVNKRFHDFGTIKEDGGTVQAEFIIKNTGNSNLIIINAEPSCGCTVSDWTKDSILPGKTGKVVATFDPKNMVGIIDKTIGVYTNAKYSSVLVLELRGEVTPRDKSMDDIFPYRVGNLRFDQEMIELGNVPHNASDSGYVVMYNDGQYPIKINNISPLPEGFRIRPVKKIIEPGKEVRLYASIDAYTLKDFGPFNKAFRLYTDDPQYSEKPLYLFGHVSYNFGKMSKKALKKAPRIKLDRTSHDFGEQAMGAYVTTDFTVSNNGKNPLKILAVKAQCSCTTASIDKSELLSNESTKLHIKFDLLGHAGLLQKPVTLYTNDPKNPTIDVVVRAMLF